MNVVAVMRLLNEDDVIEANIRHHLAHLDRIIILDDGSADRTLGIIEDMIQEGLAITLIEKPCIVSSERERNTFLYNTACRDFDADWVFFIDADEFIDMRGRVEGFSNFIKTVPPNFESILLPIRNYMDTIFDKTEERVVPQRMIWRTIENIGVLKVAVRGKIPGNIQISEGNHTAYRDGIELHAFGGSNLCIAHYPRRSGWQDIYKWIIMRLKITAAGRREVTKGTGSHYIEPLRILMNDPNRIINDKGFFERTPNSDYTMDMMKYDGGDLKYTEDADYKAKCIKLVLQYSFSLARAFGQEMDENEQFRNRILA
ncbi:glycosyltransferase family 2 protein [Novacetimonas hansenii]|uniref:glycosyltransferase family 2 protein n=1 Tax=Novacetimonas hansenii TaxID=436 RepID=UPI0009D72F1C|nr:glycosyltransferase family 2 protein [Novacetimonas hansenii]